MSCPTKAKQCDSVMQAAGVPETVGTWAGSWEGGPGHCPECGGFLTEAGVCNNTRRHNWVMRLDREARTYGATAQDVMEQDPRFDDPEYTPTGSPSAYMTQASRDLVIDDTPDSRDTLESLADEFEDAAKDGAVNDPAYLEAIKVLNNDAATEGETQAALKKLSGALRKKVDADFESDALSQADELLSAARLRRTTLSAPAPQAPSTDDMMREQIKKQMAALDGDSDDRLNSYSVSNAKHYAGRNLNADNPSPRTLWGNLYGLSHATDVFSERARTPETANSDKLLTQTGAELWNKPLSEGAYKSREEAEAAGRWMTNLARQTDDPDTETATAAVKHVLGFAGGEQWRKDDLEAGDAARLMRHADWSEIGAEDTGKFFETYYGMTDTGSEEETAVMNAMLNNPTTTPELLNNRFPGLADTLKKPGQIAALVNHPNFGKAGQEKLRYSPKMTTRKTLAASANTHPDILKGMIKDPNRQVALTALRNGNQPLGQAVEAGRESGVSDTQLLVQMRQKTRTWRDTPRCSVCGAWTKSDGVCRNGRCGAEGRKTAEAKRWPPMGTKNMGVEVQGSVYDKFTRNYSKRAEYRTVRENWADAMQDKKPLPKQWRGAIAEGVERLATMGEYDLGQNKTLGWNEKYGAYTLNGVPVPADSAGQAVRNALKMLNSDGQAYGAITDMSHKLEWDANKELAVGGKILRINEGDDKTQPGTLTIHDGPEETTGRVIGEMPPQEDAEGRVPYTERAEARREAVERLLTETGVPPYRYSKGHGKMVLQTEAEPERFEPSAPIEGEVTDKAIPARLTGYGKGQVIRPGMSSFYHRTGEGITLHNTQSPGYLEFKPGDDDLSLPAAEVKMASKTLKPIIAKETARPTLATMWRFSQSDMKQTTAGQYGFKPKSYWAATDGFRLAMVAGESDAKGVTNIHPDTAKLAADSGDVRFNRNLQEGTMYTNAVSGKGAAFTTKDGYRAEATMREGKYPDVSQIIPPKQEIADWPAFEITQKIPKEYLRANSVNSAEMYHKDGSLYMRIRDDRGDDTVTHDVEVGKLTGTNHYPEYEDRVLSGVNMQYFNDMVDVTPGKKGNWTLRMQGQPEYSKSIDHNGRERQSRILKPMVFTHSTDEAFGLVMPMNIGNS